jgi:uncharacterized protein YbgA (DUF1722 family)/uncharacterized protein YbbK (DUF523 family)
MPENQESLEGGTLHIPMSKYRKAFARPQVVVSRCLGFDACRYNGVTIPDAFVEQLGSYVTYVTVCPEAEIGLGIPRDPVRIVVVDGAARLVQPATGRDVTEQMRAFAEEFFQGLERVDGFILKGRSPSCGIKDVKQYRASVGKDGKQPIIDKAGVGIFGSLVKERYPHLPVEEEGRLSNFTLREHFLTALFTLASFRTVKAAGSVGELVSFHSDNKLLLLAYNESQLRRMGPVVANPLKAAAEDVITTYEAHLWKALVRPPRTTAGINVLMHALGYFSEKLSSEEKAYFLDSLQRYRQHKVPLSVPLNLIGAWIVRFDEPYLARQSFFAPYPEELITISDSGKGRDLR